MSTQRKRKRKATYLEAFVTAIIREMNRDEVANTMPILAARLKELAEQEASRTSEARL